MNGEDVTIEKGEKKRKEKKKRKKPRMNSNNWPMSGGEDTRTFRHWAPTCDIRLD